MKPKYLKIFSSPMQLVSVLQERGMSIDKDIARSKDDFIKHFQNTYSDKYPHYL